MRLSVEKPGGSDPGMLSASLDVCPLQPPSHLQVASSRGASGGPAGQQSSAQAEENGLPAALARLFKPPPVVDLRAEWEAAAEAVRSDKILARGFH